MENIVKASWVDAHTYRCIYSEKWAIDGPVNPLHDWLIKVVKSGGTCDLPNQLPKLVCSETNFKLTAKGGRGGVWLLFSPAKTPLKKCEAHRLTRSHITFEIVYGVDRVTMRCDLGPDWLKAQEMVNELERFRTEWSPQSGNQDNFMFPLVDRGTDESESHPQDEAA